MSNYSEYSRSELETMLTEYKQTIEEISRDTPMAPGIITAGPFKDETKEDYLAFRVSIGSNDVVCYYDRSFIGKLFSTKPEIGTTVLVINSKIVKVLPKELEVKKKKTVFNLINWENIGGYRSQIGTIRESVELPLNNKNLSKSFGLNPIKGLLLYGPPGCGKTLIAKAIASMILKSDKATDDSFVYVKGPELLDKYVGNAEKSISNIFKTCRNTTQESGQPVVLFIDEADALLSRRGSGISSDVNKTIVPMFLSEMDGFEDNNPFIILATNIPNQLDPAIIRPGRIDLKIEIKRPSKEDAIDILQIHLNKVLKHDTLKPEELCLVIDNIFDNEGDKKVSGAMLETLTKMAAQRAMARYLNDKKSPKGVIKDDLLTSINLIN